ncbi:2-succinyl-5-enolpyruvyl-6-hydroxy-3-cyclohexene-1-carboxylic-acid synthase [Vibrio gallicus]|uniref:2-succinyl-5-enolpyruvyl-6-hydroxy-3- cyclohexene-1-carboxylic-acid synthase n=1 Tax=Vibrio gallicus TaxID=190897 RepID=UPI0021C2A99A|nr:2-succinyl-5-enolpyruvyl-6-hydroxy-3-cyclohexene-1-carboxylic-acid synthase [Vibrio gallicus]
MNSLSTKQLDQPQLNRLWSAVILEELVRSGVQHVCVAPGSRSTPLALEAESNSRLDLKTHFDERGLGFLALGIAKASSAPVAIIVTSGTAVANLLPAVAEANLTGEKLILLTADRPVDLIGCGANQAIVQSNIFSNHVCQTVELPSPNADLGVNWLLSHLDDALAVQAEQSGPLHINCAFPEPLYTNHPCSLAQIKEMPKAWLQGEGLYTQTMVKALSSLDIKQWLNQHRHQKGMVVIGRTDLTSARNAKHLAQALGWPVLCDPQSGESSSWASYDIWLQNPDADNALAQCECILQFGGRVVSKRLLAFIAKVAASWPSDNYTLVSCEPSRLNPDHLPMTRVQTVEWLDDAIIPGSHAAWADAITLYSDKVTEQLNLVSDHQLSELVLASHLHQIQQGYRLFMGNSLGVRLVDMFSPHALGEIYSNRGASGIDGLVASAAGVATVAGEPVLLFIGDTSLLHDLNSLALHRNTGNIIIVVNNDGGAIFDMLPVDASFKQKLYQMPHAYQFEHAARQFGLDYLQLSSLESVIAEVSLHRTSNTMQTKLIEVVTPPEQATEQIRAITKQVCAI